MLQLSLRLRLAFQERSIAESVRFFHMTKKRIRNIFRGGILAVFWCCYIMVVPETIASKNGNCLTQQMCHTMILFHNGYTIKKDKKVIKIQCFFCYVLNNIGFSQKRKACKIKIRIGVYAFQDPVMQQHRFFPNKLSTIIEH